jgi:hypothetical protein
VTDYFKSFDFGFVYGSEIAFKSGWGIQALFNSGVLSVDKGDHWGKNFLATAGGYYRFPAKNTK